MTQRLDDLAAFALVAKERSFTRAGAKLGVSASALSQTIKGLEARLGLRLLARTTRSVAPTEAGERLVDIVAEGFDAGVRLGEQVAKDMIALRIGPDLRMAVVGSPAYFAARPRPLTPQDLTEHNCINMRLPTYGGLFAWEFEKDGREVKVRVDGQLVVNTIRQRLDGALQGLGLAYMPQDVAAPHLASGELVRVLEDWCEPFSGYHLYYPSRRHASPAFSKLAEALRWRGG